MRRILFSPSICTGGYGDVIETMQWLESKNVDRIHIDIMDGLYVKPIMGGVDYVNMIRANTKLPVELHFMTRDPERFLAMYGVQQGEIVYIHADTTLHPHRLLQTIRAKGAEPGCVISVNDEPVDFEELFTECAHLMLMGVRPGFPGSAFNESVFWKIECIRRICEEQSLRIPVQIDGSVSPDNIQRLIAAGFDCAVLGYPGCFDPVMGREHTIDLMMRLAEEFPEECSAVQEVNID